ncbi:MAG: nuclear transport factor 2 family protein [Bacteroidales bacterium]|jgi:hypothetical protein
MKNLKMTINGSEPLASIDDDKLKSVVLFYKAFNQRDLDLMQKVWLSGEASSMNNPVGGIMRGWDNIKVVYRKIFNGKAKVYVEFYDFSLHATEKMFLVTGRERGFFEIDDIKMELAIRTSRVFIKENKDW